MSEVHGNNGGWGPLQSEALAAAEPYKGVLEAGEFGDLCLAIRAGGLSCDGNYQGTIKAIAECGDPEQRRAMIEGLRAKAPKVMAELEISTSGVPADRRRLVREVAEAAAELVGDLNAMSFVGKPQPVDDLTTSHGKERRMAHEIRALLTAQRYLRQLSEEVRKLRPEAPIDEEAGGKM